MNAKTDESHGAVAGQVERSVRPRAWIGPVWQLMNDSIYEAWSEKYPDDAQHFAPLYDQAALDAAVAAERERCAKLCEEVESQAWALWKTTADPIEQGRNIGAQHCADAIRA